MDGAHVLAVRQHVLRSLVDVAVRGELVTGARAALRFLEHHKRTMGPGQGPRLLRWGPCVHSCTPNSVSAGGSYRAGHRLPLCCRPLAAGHGPRPNYCDDTDLHLCHPIRPNQQRRETCRSTVYFSETLLANKSSRTACPRAVQTLAVAVEHDESNFRYDSSVTRLRGGDSLNLKA